MPDTHAARRARARQQISSSAADAALITGLANVRYLSGLASSNAALLLPADGDPVLATDSRYAQAAARDCPDLELRTERQVGPALVSLAAARGLRAVAFEAHVLTVEDLEMLAGIDGAPALVPLGRMVEQLRAVKDDDEIELIGRACAITSEALGTTLSAARTGMTERELAVAVERAMADRGAEGLAFETIVAGGPNGALPHHVPTDRPLRAGDMITVDCGARYAGYHADLTRTVVLGQPAGWQQEIYGLVAAAQQAGLAAARPGADVRVVDAAARDMIAAAGHDGHFGHGLGHGVGLEVHEEPIIGYGRTGTLGDRTVITVEPGIYLPGRGGVRIEDTVAVRSGNGSGSPQMLTTTSRELLVL